MTGIRSDDARAEPAAGGEAPATGETPPDRAGEIARLETRLRAREREIKRLLAKLDEQVRNRTQLNQAIQRHVREQAEARAEIALLRGSLSFRLGNALVLAARNPMRLPRLFLQVVQLLGEVMPRIARRLRRGWRAPARDESPDLGPVLPLTADAAEWASRGATDGERIARMLVGTPTAPVLPEDLASIRIATIMDEFSFNAFRHCGNLRQIGAADWKAEIKAFDPQMLLVESAWKGRDESWARKIYPLSRELVELVAWCRERRIPTVFWNKEDPVHLSVFMRTARQFDFVFTTDIDCVRSYKAALGHDQVYLLPFACQPAEHNPIEEFQRTDGFCFAGSFYAKYPERQRDFAAIVKAMHTLRPVEIYDRNAGKDDAGLAYPEVYAPMIRGSLPHEQIAVAYKGYRFGININTVKQSQSMFARRAFDLLGCNTVTVSNFSRGLRMLLGDLVISSDSGDELARRVAPLLADERRYRRFRLAGLRKVLSEHTYRNRLDYILEKVGGKQVPADLPHVVVVAHARDAGEAGRIREFFDAQAYPDRELVLVMPADAMVDAREGRESVLSPEQAASVVPGEQWPRAWIACFQGGDFYGRHYLTDLALATRYTKADAIGKSAHFVRDAAGVRLVDADQVYLEHQVVPYRRAIVRTSALGGLDVLALAANPAATIDDEATSIDEFNYCADGGPSCAEAEDAGDLWTGIPLERLQRIAEGADAGASLVEYELSSPAMEADALAELLPAGPREQGLVQLACLDGELRLESLLPGERHAYVYATTPIPAERLFHGLDGKFNVVVDTEMLLSFVLIFLDAERKRIGHAIRACSSNLTVSAPAGTRLVRIGLRVQGPGTASIRRLVLGHVPSPMAGVPAPGRHLVVTRGYPDYANLYSYAYVHRRVRAYAAAGVAVDVFRLGESDVAFGEFEGVDVVSGKLADLDLTIRSNPYRTLMVHSLDRALWSVLKEHAADRKIVIWVHGAEIQPWYRRDFSFTSERDRERGIQRSNDRMEFWREFLSDIPDNVKLVFVSRHLVREAERDVGLEIDPARCEVVHNFIDGELFHYRPKESGDRLKLLSIRPYSRRTYANDLTVKAILDLAAEPWFGELSFRLVGDGALFDEVVAPLRGFPNVVLEKRFLSQREIAELHAGHGVFLAPSRIDSQGVSRDEAMASGLVPITNRVSAIPEFVDDSCGIMVPPEDWKGIADGIRRLYHDPDAFLAMSRAAAARVSAQSGRAATIERELALVESWPGRGPTARHDPPRRRRKRFAVYGDLDVNLIDGSAIWAASVAELLAGNDDADVDLYLKAPIGNTHVVRSLLGLVNVRLVEPPPGVARRGRSEALDTIIEADRDRPYDAVLLRGFELAREAVGRDALAGRLWVYLTDVPQDAQAFTSAQLDDLRAIAGGAARLLCQTPALAEHLARMAPAAAGKTRLLPPIVPRPGASSKRRSGGPLRLAYAGKFAPLWGMRELFAAVDTLRAEGVELELHAFGDKIHNPADDPGFRDEVQERLESGNGIIWYRGMDRAAVLDQLQGMDVGWAWRHPELEERTLELSTKVLEYATCGAAPLLFPGPINRQLLGDDYPLFCDREGILQVLRRLASEPAILADSRARSGSIVEAFFFDAVRARHVVPLLTEGDGAA